MFASATALDGPPRCLVSWRNGYQGGSSIRELLKEIQRRNVSRVALVYIVAGWLTMQVVDVMFPALRLPEWMTSAVAALILIGFPFAIIFAWAFEMTPDGIKREKDVDRSESITPQTGQKLNRTALIILALAVAFLLFDKFMLQPGTEVADEPVAVAETKPSIAVLPFVNMSDDKENEYFSEGLSEELLNLLARIPQLHVAGRTSSFKFKDTNEDLRIIGEALNVDHVLEGSVRKSGPRLRITAQLIDTENGYHLWSDTYDRDLTDIFAIQDEIAGHVVEALKTQLLGTEAGDANRGTTNVEAYNSFLRASYFLNDSTTENLAKAVEYFEKAIELDPEFARAYAGLALAQQQVYGGWTDSSGGNFLENFELMRGNVETAYRLAPDHPETLIAKTMFTLLSDWDLPGAIAVIESAVELFPENTNVLTWHASNLLFARDFAGAEAAVRKAQELDPLSIPNSRVLGDVYMASGRCDLAIETYQTALTLSPDAGRLHGRIARCLLFQGKIDEARVQNAKEPVEWVRETNELIFLSREQPDSVWEAAVRDYEARYGLGNSYQMAEIYADAGYTDKAFEWLETAAEIRDPGGSWALVMPFFDDMKSDPRWPEYEARFGL